MKILAAFDSFKESMSAYEAGEAVRRGAMGHHVIIKPMADGGEGTMMAMNASMSGVIHKIKVTGPLFREVQAQLALCDGLAIIECAQACGLDKLKEEEKVGLQTTSLGVGEMIRYAYLKGARRFLITLGGTASNDGGMGMLTSLGIRFLDQHHHEVHPVAQSLHDVALIDMSAYLFKDADIEIVGACDVVNPLCGSEGATYVFGPQKGIPQSALLSVDQGMKSYSQLVAKLLDKDISTTPGSGAAGGLGFAIMAFMNGRLEKGFDQVARVTHLEEAIQEVDLVMTGEGKMDEQTLYGKTPLGVLKLAKKHHKPTVAFAGKIEDRRLLKQAGFEDVRCINHEELPLEELLKHGSENLTKEVKMYLEERKNG